MPGNYDTGFGANNRHRLREHVASRNFIGEPNVCCEAFNSLDRQMSAHGLNWVINGRPRPLRYEAPLMPTWSQNWDVEANERGVATHLVNVALVGTENYGAQPPMDSAPATLIVEEYLDNLQFNQVMDDSADLGNSDDATAGPDSSDDDFRDSSTPDVTTEEESLDYSSSDGSSVGAVEMTPAQMMKLVIMPLGEAARNEIAAETPLTPRTAAELAGLPPIPIIDVWKENLIDEIGRIYDLSQHYMYVSLDTEFPGVIFQSNPDELKHGIINYVALRRNVNHLRLIQLGLTLLDDKGNHPPGILAWQFNFEFDVGNEPSNEESIALLKTCGIDFERMKTDGIEPETFAKYLTMSGLLLNDNLTWVSFQGCYDFAYLIKLLTKNPLPREEDRFFQVQRVLFPRSYDIKKIIWHAKVDAGLSGLAKTLNVERIGRAHQAGSDAHLAGKTFLALIQSEFLRERLDGNYQDYIGQLYGLAECNFPMALALFPEQAPIPDEETRKKYVALYRRHRASLRQRKRLIASGNYAGIGEG